MLNSVDASVATLVQYARERSPYYRSLYADLPDEFQGIESLPITDSAAYWKASNAEGEDGVLTEPLTDAVVMRSGGSTSEPKTVYLTRSEFHATSQISAALFAQHCGIIPGDRIANLCSQGGMYSGFLAFGYTIMNCPLPVVNLPISGKEPLEVMLKDVLKHKATVIIANVFTATKLANFAREKGTTLPAVRQICFMGESFYADLRPLFSSVFPNSSITPARYASSENQFLAYPEHRINQERPEDADIDPVFRAAYSAVVLEILDENEKPIKTEGQRGTVVVTNLLKRLQPTIRYRVGDIAEWIDYEQGLFKLRGRSGQSLKLGTAQLDWPLLRRITKETLGEALVTDNFQVVVRRRESQNVLVFRIVSEPPQPQDAGAIPQRLEEAIVANSPAWTRNRDSGQLAPVEVEWIKMSDLVFINNSGKLKRLVDERF